MSLGFLHLQHSYLRPLSISKRCWTIQICARRIFELLMRLRYALMCILPSCIFSHIATNNFPRCILVHIAMMSSCALVPYWAIRSPSVLVQGWKVFYWSPPSLRFEHTVTWWGVTSQVRFRAEELQSSGGASMEDSSERGRDNGMEKTAVELICRKKELVQSIPTTFGNVDTPSFWSIKAMRRPFPDFSSNLLWWGSKGKGVVDIQQRSLLDCGCGRSIMHRPTSLGPLFLHMSVPAIDAFVNTSSTQTSQ